MSSLAASSVVTFLINAVWQIALIAGAGGLAARLLKRLGPQAEHIAWVSTLIAAIVTPVLPLVARMFQLLPFPPPARPSFVAITLDIASGTVTGARGVYAIPASALWFALALYLGLTFYFAARLVRALHSTVLLLRDAKRVALTSEQSELLEQCRNSFSLQAVKVLRSSRIASPVAIGISRGVLILPEDFATQCASHDLLVALAHECAHIKRRDFTKNLCYEMASLIVAFHPATWFIKSQIAQTRELVCDASVTEKLVDPRSYAHSLLRLAALAAVAPRVSTSPAVGIFDANILEKRIMSINLKKQSVSSMMRCGLAVPAIVLLLVAATAAAAMALTVEQQTQSRSVSQTSPYGQVYRIGKDVSAPVPLRAVNADFPKAARDVKPPFDQIVIVHLIVDAAGLPRNVHAAPSGKPDFDAQAVKAVEQYRFTPAQRAGAPVAAALSIEVNFKKY
ncbi:MAG TPA: M56 family metallopeptidase [Terracidiphilus sp.]|jgi:TonB family protein|nr:M56 family metallopeptidase [Terracidiphilus sp.]